MSQTDRSGRRVHGHQHASQDASWAFYSGVPGRRGLGTRMEVLALDHAFEKLGLEKLSCEVLGFNTPVIEMRKKFGFRVAGIFVKQFRTDNGYTDIYRLAMFKNDWLGERQAQMRAKIQPSRTDQ